jgi:hypothetical protein
MGVTAALGEQPQEERVEGQANVGLSLQEE